MQNIGGSYGLKILHQMKKAKHKRLHIVWFYLYNILEMPNWSDEQVVDFQGLKLKRWGDC